MDNILIYIIRIINHWKHSGKDFIVCWNIIQILNGNYLSLEEYLGWCLECWGPVY